MRIKEAKRNRQTKRRLLAVVAIMMCIAFALFVACGFKTLYCAIVSTNKNLVLIGTACSLAAMFVTVKLQNLLGDIQRRC